MAKAGKTSSIKYNDKSAGQPELLPVFEDLKRVLSKFSKGNYTTKDDFPGNYSVYYSKPVEIANRVYPELPLASVLVQKGYVGFYLFSIYTEPALVKDLQPDLRKLLKGKTCFHVKSSGASLLKDVQMALESALRYYHSRGWK